MTAADLARELADKLSRCAEKDILPSRGSLREAAALLRELAAGYAPREPTAEMFIAGTKALAEAESSFARIVWQAMHDAATGRREG